MSPAISSSSRVTFGLFEADLQSGELWKAGYRVKLQRQPFKVLTVLLEEAGRVVPREALQNRVWGPNVIVDFEHSVGSAIKKVREALGDSAENPRFIETLSRRGYRFIAPVTFPESTANKLADSAVDIANVVFVDKPPSLPETTRSVIAYPADSGQQVSKLMTWLRLATAFCLGCLVSLTVVSAWRRQSGLPPLPRMARITQLGRMYSPGDPSIETLPASAADGTRIFTSTVEQGRVALSQVSVSTGQAQEISLPSELAVPEINDVSPNGTQLLVRSHMEAASEQPLWVVPISGGSAFRVSNILAQDATWMPDGKNILYASGNQLSVAPLTGGRSIPFAKVPGRAFWLRWSPDGKLLRFTLLDSENHTSSLWEIGSDGRSPQPLLKEWTDLHNECCGTWTADGKEFVFQASQEGHTDLWRLASTSSSNPVRVTNGPLAYEAPAAARSGSTIYFVGRDVRSELEQYNAEERRFAPVRNFMSDASHLTFSQDGNWVAWTDSAQRLWRARADGTDKVQLTPDSIQVFLASWAPDGTRLALMARSVGQAWQLYMISVEGGTLERLLQLDRNVGDPSFSPDGKYIVFGRVPDLMAPGNVSRPLEILDLATSRVSDIQGSQGLFSPRWSPDGRFIAALALDQRKVMLYEVATRTWRTLATTSAADPIWSSDSKSIYIHAYMASGQPILKLDISDGHFTEVASLKSFPVGEADRYYFAGITRSNVPLVRVETFSGNLYSVNLDSK